MYFINTCIGVLKIQKNKQQQQEEEKKKKKKKHFPLLKVLKITGLTFASYQLLDNI